MSKQPLGKTLLRNVIRHTDAHNKIQEETDMWKMRGWEVQKSHKHVSDTECARGHMHCDRVADQTRDLGRSRERASEHDDREARYWTRKLYEFEANDPDRWGHSGFKELYPEDFKSDGERTKKLGRHKMKKSKSDTEENLSKHSKKDSRKKKKKKKKKGEDAKRKKANCSSSGDSSVDSSATKDKQGRRRSKNRHKNRKSSKTRGRDDSSSGGSDDGESKSTSHSRRKRKRDFQKDSASGLDLKKKRRKNGKAAGEESSRDSFAD